MNNFDLDRIEWPQSIRGINELGREIKEAMYLTLVPQELLQRFQILPNDRDRLKINCPSDTRSFEIIVFHRSGAPDPVAYIHMADTLNYQLALLLYIINDVTSPRFNVDIDKNGLPTHFGTTKRNIEEEMRAMAAGLSPGQIYRGLRLSQKALSLFETFIKRTGHDIVIIEPLTYNNAIVYEKYGFSYFQGRKRMEWIDAAFRPGGELFYRFDGSSPFRKSDAWKSIRGRAWAIQDGILDEPFGDIRMNKRIGHNAGVNTFTDAVW